MEELVKICSWNLYAMFDSSVRAFVFNFIHFIDFQKLHHEQNGGWARKNAKDLVSNGDEIAAEDIGEVRWSCTRQVLIDGDKPIGALLPHRGRGK